jgi:hypothetical protein
MHDYFWKANLPLCQLRSAGVDWDTIGVKSGSPVSCGARLTSRSAEVGRGKRSSRVPVKDFGTPAILIVVSRGRGAARRRRNKLIQ